MPTRTKLLLGGLGALMPTIAVLLVAEASIIESFTTASEIIGYALRVVLLFLVGGFWVWLHKSEHDPMKVVQLGIVAPAMITGVIQAGNVPVQSPEKMAGDQAGISFTVVSSAYAQSLPAQQSSPRKPTIADCIIKGFRGKKC